jgi:hypothetical protein
MRSIHHPLVFGFFLRNAGFSRGIPIFFPAKCWCLRVGQLEVSVITPLMAEPYHERLSPKGVDICPRNALMQLWQLEVSVDTPPPREDHTEELR